MFKRALQLVLITLSKLLPVLGHREDGVWVKQYNSLSLVMKTSSYLAVDK